MKKTLLAVFYLVAAVVVGALLADIARGVPFLAWLAYGQSIGLPVETPMVLDLSVVRLCFGLEVGVTVAHILCLVGAFRGYRYTLRALDRGSRARQREEREKTDDGI